MDAHRTTMPNASLSTTALLQKKFPQSLDKNKEDAAQTWIVKDTLQDAHYKNWRTFDLKLKNGKTLHVSTSSQPDAPGWNDIVKKLYALHGNDIKIFVSDFRGENHGYIDGIPVTQAGLENWIDVENSNEKILDAPWLSSLTQQTEITHVLNTEQYKVLSTEQYKKTCTGGDTILAKNIKTEEALLSELDVAYKRFLVPDHGAFNDVDVQRFIDFFEFLQKSTENICLHMHCRGGCGRSALGVALLLILACAGERPLEEIIEQINNMSPPYDLSKNGGTSEKFRQKYIKRYEFIETFYAFVKAYKRNPALSWEVWKKERNNTNISPEIITTPSYRF